MFVEYVRRNQENVNDAYAPWRRGACSLYAV